MKKKKMRIYATNIVYSLRLPTYRLIIVTFIYNFPKVYSDNSSNRNTVKFVCDIIAEQIQLIYFYWYNRFEKFDKLY